MEGEIATAAREVPRFAAGGKGSGSGGPHEVAARLASRQRLATKYSRCEAEVSLLTAVRCVVGRGVVGKGLLRTLDTGKLIPGEVTEPCLHRPPPAPQNRLQLEQDSS